MGKLPVLKPREVCRIWSDWDFRWYGKGSHMQYRHADGRGTTVPNHAGREISPILLRQIARDIGMTAEDFISHR
jgi:predicted RNA binding protein YcfA (HicA-like mRNA interferase family)